jgi:hypothetical protein
LLLEAVRYRLAATATTTHVAATTIKNKFESGFENLQSERLLNGTDECFHFNTGL